MEIQITDFATKTYSVKDYVSRQLDGDEPGSGVVEAAARTGANTADAFGRLIDKLAEKGLLSAEDVVEIVDDLVTASFVK